MATNLERLTAVVEAITNRPATPAQLGRIANAFAEHWRAELNALVVDQEAPTNNELAGFVLLKLRAIGQDVLRAQARSAVARSMQADLDNAGDAAIGDF